MSPFPLELTPKLVAVAVDERLPVTSETFHDDELPRVGRPAAIVFLRPKLSIAVGGRALTVDVRPGASSTT